MRHIKKVDNKVLEEFAVFHGTLSPGLIIGAYMVELAFEKLGDVELIDAVVESKKCIPDAVQLMTSCTFGNSWMKVYDWGIFAITLYDKRSKKGVRVYLDTNKIPEGSIIEEWFFMKNGKKTHEEVNPELLRLKKSLLSYQFVEVILPEKERPEIKLCPICGNAFPSFGIGRCKSCNEGITYYRKIGKTV